MLYEDVAPQVGDRGPLMPSQSVEAERNEPLTVPGGSGGTTGTSALNLSPAPSPVDTFAMPVVAQPSFDMLHAWFPPPSVPVPASSPPAPYHQGSTPSPSTPGLTAGSLSSAGSSLLADNHFGLTGLSASWTQDLFGADDGEEPGEPYASSESEDGRADVDELFGDSGDAGADTEADRLTSSLTAALEPAEVLTTNRFFDADFGEVRPPSLPSSLCRPCLVADACIPGRDR